MLFSGKLSRNECGVGSIIGAAFMLLIILSGFTFYALVQNVASRYNKTISSVNEMDWNRSREKIEVKEAKITGANKLNLTVENTGTIRSHLIWLGLFNKTATPESQGYYPLDELIGIAETRTLISDFTVIRGKKYVIQLVTELGNTAEHKFYPASESHCALTLIVAPPTVYQGNNITLLVAVTHNDTEVDTIQNLTVSLRATPSGLVEAKEQPIALSIETLRQGKSAFFRWVYSTKGTGSVVFNATYDQAPTGVFATSALTISSPPLTSAGNVGNVTITGPSTTPKNTLATYTVKITYLDGTGITRPYFLSIYVDGNNVQLSSPPTGYGTAAGTGNNPWFGVVDLDANGEFTFEFKTTRGDQTIIIFVQVGYIIGEKTVVIPP